MKYLRFQRLRAYENILLIYRKILKMSAEAYIFRGPFLRGLFVEGLIFGGAYLRREICFSKSIGLASLLEVNLPFLLCFTLYSRGQFSKYKPPGGLYLEGDLTESFCVSDLGGLIFGVAYTWRGLFSEFYDTIHATWHQVARLFEEPTFISRNPFTNQRNVEISVICQCLSHVMKVNCRALHHEQTHFVEVSFVIMILTSCYIYFY